MASLHLRTPQRCSMVLNIDISETARHSQGFGARHRLGSAPKRFHSLPNAQEHFPGFRGYHFTSLDITSTSGRQQCPNPVTRGPLWDTKMSVIQIPRRLPFRLLHKSPIEAVLPHRPSSSYLLHLSRSGLASAILIAFFRMSGATLRESHSLFIAWSTPCKSTPLPA